MPTTILIVTGKTGLGKSWLACALGHKACRDNRSVLYQRVPKLFSDLALARGDGRHARLLRTLSRVDLLILDDFGLGPLDAQARQDLLEIVEERYGRRSTIITSQPPVDAWHALIGEPTYADAILDRIVHNAHRIELDGETIRKTRARAGKKRVRPMARHPNNLRSSSAQHGSAKLRSASHRGQGHSGGKWRSAADTSSPARSWLRYGVTDED